MIRISTDMFFYSKGTFSQEVSTLGRKTLDKIWESDVPSFMLVSTRTTNALKMVLVKRHMDRENELTHWEFKPAGIGSFNNLILWND